MRFVRIEFNKIFQRDLYKTKSSTDELSLCGRNHLKVFIRFFFFLFLSLGHQGPFMMRHPLGLSKN